MPTTLTGEVERVTFENEATSFRVIRLGSVEGAGTRCRGRAPCGKPRLEAAPREIAVTKSPHSDAERLGATKLTAERTSRRTVERPADVQIRPDDRVGVPEYLAPTI